MSHAYERLFADRTDPFRPIPKQQIHRANITRPASRRHKSNDSDFMEKVALPSTNQKDRKKEKKKSKKLKELQAVYSQTEQEKQEEIEQYALYMLERQEEYDQQQYARPVTPTRQRPSDKEERRPVTPTYTRPPFEGQKDLGHKDDGRGVGPPNPHPRPPHGNGQEDDGMGLRGIYRAPKHKNTKTQNGAVDRYGSTAPRKMKTLYYNKYIA